MARSIARQAVMQLLYEKLSGGEGDEESLSMVCEQLGKADSSVVHLTTDDRAYIEDALSGIQQNRCALDETIEKYSTGDWSLSRVSNVDLSILRLATYEMFYRTDIPVNVAISEAMELAEKYSEPKSGRYINGVLGAISRDQQDRSS